MDTDGHDPSFRTPTRLAGSPMARDLENKRITRVMSLQRVGKVGRSSRSDADGHDPSLRIPTRLFFFFFFASVGFNAINGKCIVGKENR